MDNLSLMDHYLQLEMMGAADQPMLEGYTSLGFLAGLTSTVELQLLVTGVTYRHPGLLAKIVSTLDVLSGGRAVLGIGAAWYEREHRALGVAYPPLAERFERLEETLQIVRQMWSEDDGPFEGKHFQLAETINSPQPLRTPPILVGGGGEKKTLRLVAKYADALQPLRRAGRRPVPPRSPPSSTCCAGTASARAPTTTASRRPCSTPLPWPRAPTRRAFAEAMTAYAAVGVTEVHVMPMDGDPVGFVRNLGEHVDPSGGRPLTQDGVRSPSWTAQVLPSGSLKKMNEPNFCRAGSGPGTMPPASKWTMPPLAMPLASRWAWAASMSETTNWLPLTEPGVTSLPMPLPKTIEQPEPGGVTCTNRKSSPAGGRRRPGSRACRA